MIVTSFDGLWLHIGGPGAGKTRDLIRQAAVLDNLGVPHIIVQLEEKVSSTLARLATARQELGLDVAPGFGGGLIVGPDEVKTVDDLAKLVEAHQPHVVLVDNAFLLDTRSGLPTHSSLIAIAMALKGLSSQYGTAIMATLQSSRDGHVDPDLRRVASILTQTPDAIRARALTAA